MDLLQKIELFNEKSHHLLNFQFGADSVLDAFEENDEEEDDGENDEEDDEEDKDLGV